MASFPSDLRAIARATGGEVVGRQVVAPGPGHSPRDRSLSVTISAAAPEGFLAFSHAGDDFAECRDHVKARLGIGPRHRPGGRRSRRAMMTATRAPSCSRSRSRSSCVPSLGRPARLTFATRARSSPAQLRTCSSGPTASAGIRQSTSTSPATRCTGGSSAASSAS